MKKYLVFSFLATILFTACDDTRQAMHDEYLEFVMHTDSLETVHEAMVVSHEAVKADTRTLAQKLKDVEATDSIAMADVQEHQTQLKAQATSDRRRIYCTVHLLMARAMNGLGLVAPCRQPYRCRDT